jgi:hypothetical protein
VPDTTYLIAAVLLAATITFALRAVPFAVIEPLRSGATPPGCAGAVRAPVRPNASTSPRLRRRPHTPQSKARATVGKTLPAVGLAS